MRTRGEGWLFIKKEKDMNTKQYPMSLEEVLKSKRDDYRTKLDKIEKALAAIKENPELPGLIEVVSKL